jgi:putative ABC transport system permease protein
VTIRRVVRRLLQAPLFTAVAVLTLGVGIGANAAIFSVINGVLLKPLPYAEPDRLVGTWHTAPGLNIPLLNQAPSLYLTYRDDGRVFEDVAMWDNNAVSITGAGEPERVTALDVTDGLLPILRVDAAAGRRFNKDDDSPRTPPRVMLTHAYWQRKFGGDPGAIGKQITIDGTPTEVIGVLPPGFRFLSQNPQILLPMRINRAEVFVGHFSFRGLARLKPGVTIEQANADVARMIPMVMDRYPMPPGFTRQMFEEARIGPNVRPLSADVIGDVGRVLWVLLGTVGIVLLIACANVANLFLIRAEGRQQELAVQTSLGASPGRIVRELLSESVTLGAVGGAVGLALAYAGIRLLVATAPEGLPRVNEIGIDATVVAFTIGVSLVAGLLFGLLPAAKLARPHLATALKAGGRGSSDGRERHRARNVLVTAEIALAVVLLVGSGLMLRTFQALRDVEPGFTQPEDVLTLRVSIPETLVADPEQAIRMHEQIVHRIEQVPGVRSVGTTSSITMDGNDSSDPVFVEDAPVAPGVIPPLRRYKWIGPNYFETMGNRVVAGRALTWEDSYARVPNVVVNEKFAREFWKEPSQALGRRIRNTPGNPWRTIVGVVANEFDNGTAQPAPAIIYWPLVMNEFWTQRTYVQRNLAYAIRTDRIGSGTLLKEIQQAVWSVNSSLPVASIRTLNEIRADSMAQTSFALVMLAIAAVVALLLGVIGIYGVVAYVAAQRTREIGIRMALGADRGAVSRLFVRHGLALIAGGVTVGLIAAALVTRVMASLLFGVTPTDPLTYVTVATGLSATALLATYLPARRAARVDPAIALRSGL